MLEKLDFIEINSRRYFIHIHLSSQSNRKAILIFNPILDEKKRVQKFEAETARELSRLGYAVVRFDYFGTGDSGGDTFEFNFNAINSDSHYLFDYINRILTPDEIIYFGIRLGADLALINSLSKPNIKRLILVEPIIDGKRYLLELRMRKKVFYRLNNLQAVENIFIHGSKFEDFQGYPISTCHLAYLDNLNLNNFEIKNKHIAIFKTNSLANKRLVFRFKEQNDLKDGCCIDINNVDCPEFWSALEFTDTKKLTQQIISYINRD